MKRNWRNNLQRRGIKGAALTAVILSVWGFRSPAQAAANTTGEIRNKLTHIIIPSLEFKKTPFSEVLKILRTQSVKLDVKERDPEKKGVHFLLLSSAGKGEERNALVTLKFSSPVSLGDVLSYASAHARMEYKVNSRGVMVSSFGTNDLAKSRIEKKLKNIIIPSVEFRDTPLSEVLKILQQKSKEFDVEESNPAKKGIDIVFQAQDRGYGLVPVEVEGIAAAGKLGVTMRLTKVPVGEVLRYTVGIASLNYKIEPPFVRVATFGRCGDLPTRVFIVPGDLLSKAPGERVGGDLAKGKTAKEILMGAGVSFPPGTSAIFNSENSALIVRNTGDQIKLIGKYVESIKGTPLLDWR